MLIKIVGAGIVIISAMLCAERRLTEEKKKIEHLDAFISIISHIKNQIDLYSMPLEKIFAGIDSDKLRRLGINEKPTRFSELMSSDGICLEDDTRRVLREFSSSIGKGYREMQIKLCESTLSELILKKKSLADIFPSRRKTVLALYLGIGGAAVIAFI